jgi:DNA modification methylase
MIEPTREAAIAVSDPTTWILFVISEILDDSALACQYPRLKMPSKITEKRKPTRSPISIKCDWVNPKTDERISEVLVHCNYDELRPIKEFKPHPKNRNDHSREQVERLAEIFNFQGVRKPIYNSTLSGCITAGHGRLLAAKYMKMESFPAEWQEYADADQEQIDVTSDNAIALWAELDLAGINEDLGNLGPFDIDLLGIEGFEIDVADKYDEVDADAAPSVPKEAKSKPGELWLLGKHRLLCGDSTKREDVERLRAGEVADMVFTDPPYGVSYQSDMSAKEAKARNRRKDGKEVANDSLSGAELQSFLAAALNGWPLKPGGAFYVCSPPGNPETDFRLSLGNEFPLRQALVWAKQQFVFGRQDYHWRHETILYGWREGASHYFVDDRTQDTVWNFDRPHKSPEHPTMKPVELVEKAIQNSSRKNEIVYDGFGGSGTTLIASEKAGRRCRTIELSPSYCDVILDRFAKFTGRDPVREDGSKWSEVKTSSEAPDPSTLALGFPQ